MPPDSQENMMEEEPTYSLEQGIIDPRSGHVHWHHYEGYVDKKVALREAKKLKGRWQVVENKVIFRKE